MIPRGDFTLCWHAWFCRMPHKEISLSLQIPTTGTACTGRRRSGLLCRMGILRSNTNLPPATVPAKQIASPVYHYQKMQKPPASRIAIWKPGREVELFNVDYVIETRWFIREGRLSCLDSTEKQTLVLFLQIRAERNLSLTIHAWPDMAIVHTFKSWSHLLRLIIVRNGAHILGGVS